MKRLNTLIFALMLIFSNVVAKSSNTKLETLSNTNIPEQYMPTNKSFINWDYPVVGHTGVDIDYKMTGYDWANRDLKWELIDGPDGMRINPNDGTIHWVSASEGSYNVTVQLSLGNEETISKSFTISVDNSRSIFISPDGNNETGIGSKDKPFASFGEQVAKKIVELGGKVTIYHRAGTYGELNLDWFSRTNPNLRKLHDVLNVSKDNAIIFRNYPGEKAIIKPGTTGMRIYGTHWIYYGLDFQGASKVGLTVAKESVAKRVNVYDSKDVGIQISDNSIVDQVISGDEEESKNRKQSFSSNFTFYSTSKGERKDAFIIDSLSLYNSDTGISIAKLGNKGFLHVHKSADIGAKSQIYMSQNYNSVRNSFFYSKNSSPIVRIGGKIDKRYSDKGMLFQNNVFISENKKGKIVQHDSTVMVSEANNSVIWDNNIIETKGETEANIYRAGSLYSDIKEPWDIKFDNNSVYSSSLSNGFVLQNKVYGIDKLFTYGINNKFLDKQGKYTFTVARRTYSIDNGVLKQEIDKPIPNVPEYYLPKKLSFINWDYPVVGHTNIDVDYKMTGYDWFNRKLNWSILSGPEGMVIKPDGTIHWTPKEEGEYPVRLQLQLGEQEKLIKDFTITIDNSRCIFLSPTGDNEKGTGTIDNPYRNITNEITEKIKALGGKTIVYQRGGTYQISLYPWDALNAMELKEDTANIIRNYPGEHPIVKTMEKGNGFDITKAHWIFYGFEISGGYGHDKQGLAVYGQSVAKRMLVHGYRFWNGENPTGVKLVGSGLLDQVIAWDNKDPDPENFDALNNSNFVFYGDKPTTPGDGFMIDCLSLEKTGNEEYGSAIGYKVKHAGPYGTLHIHKSASLGVRFGFFGGMNRSSIRHSVFYAEDGAPAVRINAVDNPSDGIDPDDHTDYNDTGMLVQSNLIMNVNPTRWAHTLFQDFWAYQENPELPVIYDDNTIESRGYSNGHLFTSGRNDYLPFVIRFSANKMYTPHPENGYEYAIYNDAKNRGESSVVYDISELDKYGAGNKTLSAPGNYTFTVAGHTYNIDEEGKLTEINPKPLHEFEISE